METPLPLPTPKERKERLLAMLVGFAIGICSCAVAVLMVDGNSYPKHVLTENEGVAVIAILWISGVAMTAGTYAFSEVQRKEQREKTERKIEEAEKEVKKDPTKPKPVWDLAKVHLEDYVNRNLSKVDSIYALTVRIIVVGFILIVLGICVVFVDKDRLSIAIVASASGILTQFVGVTFLLIYKATMAQAQEYVTVLERINAVGMAIQILETIEGEKTELRNETRAQISRDLLALYGKPPVKKAQPKKKA